MPLLLRLLFASTLLLGVPGLGWAHEIPNDATVQVYIRPAGQTMQMLVRVPLSSMRDVEFPETASGYLDTEKLMPLLPDAATLWIAQFVSIYENGEALPRPRTVATQVSLPSDRSFTSFDEALRHVTGAPLGNDARLSWNQALFDVLFEYPIRAEASKFYIHSKLAQLAAQVTTVLRFVTPDGSIRVLDFRGDPGRLALDPSWVESAWQFTKLGFAHILDGADHLLFLFCLAIPLRRPRLLVIVVTAFTLAHSLTIVGSALHLVPAALWFPPLVETLIAASIVYAAIENIAVPGTAGLRRRATVAFAFGLVHGFGFSFALADRLQFAGSNLLVSLLAFNVGVELGQLFALLLIVPALWMLFRWTSSERLGTIILSALAAHTGWHWLLERGEMFSKYAIEWPTFAEAATALRWLILVLVISVFFYAVMDRWFAGSVANEGPKT